MNTGVPFDEQGRGPAEEESSAKNTEGSFKILAAAVEDFQGNPITFERSNKKSLTERPRI